MSCIIYVGIFQLHDLALTTWRFVSTRSQHKDHLEADPDLHYAGCNMMRDISCIKMLPRGMKDDTSWYKVWLGVALELQGNSLYCSAIFISSIDLDENVEMKSHLSIIIKTVCAPSDKHSPVRLNPKRLH